MHLSPDATGDRLVVATRVLDLARTGVIDVRAIRERILTEAKRAFETTPTRAYGPRDRAQMLLSDQSGTTLQ